VLEIGAGDLRLARRLARVARCVYALEIQPHVIWQGLRVGPLPPNLRVVVGDACQLPFPPGITVGVLLMRHCQHWSLYRSQLLAVGCERLITNARWRMGVELIDLNNPGITFDGLAIGWYACRCGAVGFAPGPPQALTEEISDKVHEVYNCPKCRT